MDVLLKLTVRGSVPDLGEPLKLAVGAGTGSVTVMYPALVSVSEPPGPVTVRATVYVPELVYSCDGDAELLEPPSPKLHDQLVIEPVDRSVKLTDRGGSPEVGDPLKFAVGASTGSVTVM